MNFSELRIARTIGYGNLMVKIALYASITSLTISIIFLIFFGKITSDIYHTWYSTFVWYALLASLWILMVSPVYLLIATIYGQFSENKKLKSLTGEFILLLVNIFVAGVFVVTALQLNN
jgi:hypothetical protein